MFTTKKEKEMKKKIVGLEKEIDSLEEHMKFLENKLFKLQRLAKRINKIINCNDFVNTELTFSIYKATDNKLFLSETDLNERSSISYKKKCLKVIDKELKDILKDIKSTTTYLEVVKNGFDILNKEYNMYVLIKICDNNDIQLYNEYQEADLKCFISSISETSLSEEY